MTKKRFTLQESDIYNRNDVIHDKGIEMPQSTVCDLLNEQEEEIQELKQRNRRQYERLKELTDLMQKRDWKTLEQIVEQWEKADELLKQEWGTIL